MDSPSALFGAKCTPRRRTRTCPALPASTLVHVDLDNLLVLNEAIEKVIPRDQPCTVSVGVANTPRDTRSRGPAAADELMRKADLALLAAKEQGGDAVGLTPSGDMVLKSSYYSAAQLGRLKGLAERMKKKEAVLLREALDDLLRKFERS